MRAYKNRTKPKLRMAKLLYSTYVLCVSVCVHHIPISRWLCDSNLPFPTYPVDSPHTHAQRRKRTHAEPTHSLARSPRTVCSISEFEANSTVTMTTATALVVVVDDAIRRINNALLPMAQNKN